MKKSIRAAGLFLALCILLTAFAGAAAQTSYSLDGGRVTLSLPAGWTAETDLNEGTLLLATNRGDSCQLAVIKQKVYHLIDPVTPPVVTYSAGASTSAVPNDRTSQGESGTANLNGTEFSTYFTADERSYWTDLGDYEYRFTFTSLDADFSEGELEEIGGIMETVKVQASDGLLVPVQPVRKTVFQDLEDHWAKSYAVRAVELGLFQGLSETSFGPDQPMSRAMLVTVLHRMAGKPAAGNAAFTDVAAGSYYAEAVAWAAANGIVQGSDGKFRPDDAVSRQELAAVLYRYDGLAAAIAADALKDFSDAASVAVWARDAMAWAVTEGLITGSDGKLLPAAVSTRAQVAAILVRYLDME